MNRTPILQGKHAVVFGAGGSFGSVVAREFAAEGAEVFLSGRSKPGLEEVAKHITADGGVAHVAVIDAEDPAAVDAYLDGIAREAGSIDIVFNLVGPRLKEYGGGKLATQLTVDEFMAPLARLVKSQFITSRAAARHMVEQRSGVIIFVTGAPERRRDVQHATFRRVVSRARSDSRHFHLQIIWIWGAEEVASLSDRCQCPAGICHLSSRRITGIKSGYRDSSRHPRRFRTGQAHRRCDDLQCPIARHILRLPAPTAW